MNNIILIGSGGHTAACIDVIEFSKQYKIVGLIQKDNIKEQFKLKYPILGSDGDLIKIRKEFNNALITIGQIKSPEPRVRLYQIIKNLGFKIPVILSPISYVSKTAIIGDGTIIMHGAIINANVIIGKNCIINNNALIEHDVTIGDHCHISTGAIINGGVSIGNQTFIGSGVVTKQSISIGDNCVIAAGLILKKNIGSSKVINN
tara:strand:+ start:390 stop:1001 length:612 start_codon:yes stop_codon:yes gene_type:complete